MTKLPKDYTILVVEDELPLQKIIQQKLENHGLNVITSRSVAQAKDYLQELDQVDAIWLDHYLLGDGSGLDFVAYLKESTCPYNSIPLFIVSNSVGKDKIDAYLHLGVSNYFTKSHTKLSEIISDILEQITG